MIIVTLINKQTKERVKMTCNSIENKKDEISIIGESKGTYGFEKTEYKIGTVSQEFTDDYTDGANYALYEICKELDIMSQDIRDSNDTIDGKAARIAERIKNELSNIKE